MNTLIIKLGATGDVVRTTPLLEKLSGRVTWITAVKNVPLLKGIENLNCLSWEQRNSVANVRHDFIINLEDTPESGEFVRTLKYDRLFGAFVNADRQLAYTDDSRGWFDLSLISRFGKAEADKLKLKNRWTYQDLIFNGLGFAFTGEKYVLPEPSETNLSGDVAISPKAGAVWPMKNWTYYAELKCELEANGLVVNMLPERATLLEHLGDVKNHRVLVSGDSLPMHFALGIGTRCVTIFNCTSPWEIFEYGVQRQITSPLLAEFFFKRGMDERATGAISVEEVFDAVLKQLGNDAIYNFSNAGILASRPVGSLAHPN
jgi:ADP-heptose:LPS heptosyltransferase